MTCAVLSASTEFEAISFPAISSPEAAILLVSTFGHRWPKRAGSGDEIEFEVAPYQKMLVLGMLVIWQSFTLLSSKWTIQPFLVDNSCCYCNVQIVVWRANVWKLWPVLFIISYNGIPICKPPREMKIGSRNRYWVWNIGGKITAKQIQGKRLLVREIEGSRNRVKIQRCR